MSAASTLKIVSGAIGVLNGLINLFENSAKYRQLVAKAIEEGRELTDEEVDALELEARDAIAAARAD